MPFAATWRDLETVILSEVSQTVKDKHHMISLIWGIFKKKKKDISKLIRRTEQTLKNLQLPKGTEKEVGGMDWGFGTGIRTLRYTE